MSFLLLKATKLIQFPLTRPYFVMTPVEMVFSTSFNAVWSIRRRKRLSSAMDGMEKSPFPEATARVRTVLYGLHWAAQAARKSGSSASEPNATTTAQSASFS